MLLSKKKKKNVLLCIILHRNMNAYYNMSFSYYSIYFTVPDKCLYKDWIPKYIYKWHRNCKKKSYKGEKKGIKLSSVQQAVYYIPCNLWEFNKQKVPIYYTVSFIYILKLLSKSLISVNFTNLLSWKNFRENNQGSLI